jgi:hypothetical protein
MEKFVASAPNLPHSLIGSLPVTTDPLRKGSDVAPLRERCALVVTITQVQSVNELAMDIELQLIIGSVPDAYGARAAIALQMIERLLG